MVRSKRSVRKAGEIALDAKRPRSTPAGRISPREAAHAAVQYYAELTGQTPSATVEEIDLSKDERYWNVTLGLTGDMPALFSRKYKLFQVDARTGEVRSMKIREDK